MFGAVLNGPDLSERAGRERTPGKRSAGRNADAGKGDGRTTAAADKTK